MMFFGFAEVLVLAVLSGGTTSTDLVALVQPKHYFEYRQFEPSIDKMVDLAGEDPKDAKTQITQLTSLRYLADESAALKKSPKYAAHRQALEEIAAGKKAQDPEGFAKDYANRVLMKLDNAKPKAVKRGALHEDTLNWFPAHATLVGVIDLTATRQAGGDDSIKALLKLMPDREKKQMYAMIEQSGNIRVERASFAWVDGTGKRDGEIYTRFSGKGNHEWMVEAFKNLDGGRGRFTTKKSKDDKGTPITTIQPQNGPPVLVLIGNSDLLVIGDEGGNKDQERLVTEMLAVRSKKKPNVTTGPNKDRFTKIPEKAVAMLMGNVPREMRKELAFKFDPVPTNITAFVERAEKGLDVQVETFTASKENGDKLVKTVGALRKEGIDSIKQEMQQPRRPNQPPIPFQSLINLMETLQVQSKDERVQVRVVVPDGLMQEMVTGWFGFARGIGPNCGEED